MLCENKVYIYMTRLAKFSLWLVKCQILTQTFFVVCKTCITFLDRVY